ncbi:phytoene/squalene synthase family protein [Salinarimonas ramus]|uniref:Phytoene synthase n=1 Tax=Salinarimonas ramus TaxID=690164 RepID=A0A917QCS1_9HYPH|nr:squalene/phytoene synthase family protein [Salinarimonas ramus]GGK43373.1 phytoene synthase [Salinarimonas ramus]
MGDDPELADDLGVLGAGAEANARECERIVRRDDRDRWLATLFAPAEARPALFALYAFAAEIARIPERVSEPLPGEIRLQWWRDALEGTREEEARANPVHAALTDAIARHALPRAPLLAMVEARIHDLYDDPIASVNDLEGYAGETSSVLMRLASLVLAGEGEADPASERALADAAGHGGVAYALAGLMRAFPWHVQRGRLYVPPVETLQRHGLTRDKVVAGEGGLPLQAALQDMRALAREHLARARAALASAPAATKPAFLPLALVEPALKAMERPGYDPYRTIVELPQWRRQLVLWWAARRM